MVKVKIYSTTTCPLNTQYDSAAPAIKKFISEQPMEDYVQIEKRGGVVLEVRADGSMSTNIQGHEYPVSFTKLPKIVNKGQVPIKLDIYSH